MALPLFCVWIFDAVAYVQASVYRRMCWQVCAGVRADVCADEFVGKCVLVYVQAASKKFEVYCYINLD